MQCNPPSRLYDTVFLLVAYAFVQQPSVCSASPELSKVLSTRHALQHTRHPPQPARCPGQSCAVDTLTHRVSLLMAAGSLTLGISLWTLLWSLCNCFGMRYKSFVSTVFVFPGYGLRLGLSSQTLAYSRHIHAGLVLGVDHPGGLITSTSPSWSLQPSPGCAALSSKAGNTSSSLCAPYLVWAS